MDLKEYKETPAEGMFVKIRRRLVLRRMLRVSAAATALVAVVGVVVLLALPHGQQSEVVPVAESTEVTTATAAPQTLATDVLATPVATSVVAERAYDTTIDAKDARIDVVMSQGVTDASNVSDDELASLVATLPQGTPVIMPLDEAVEPGADAILGVDTLSVTSVAMQRTQANADVHSKAGQPAPHFDNVIWAPNLIVPAGEVEDNRFFSIKATSPVTAFKIHIYNRNGRRIFMSSDAAFVWDATFDGTPVPQGAYVWVATFRDTDGNPRQESGTVTVIR